MSDLECPYCGKEQLHIDSDYGQDDESEYECEHCEKNFMLHASWEISFSSRKADCLNGGEHNYEITKHCAEIFRVLRCSMCNDEKPLPVHLINN